MKKKKNAMHLAGFEPATTGIYVPECHYRCASLPLLIWSMFDFFQNVSIVLSPTMRISHRVLNCLFENSHILFDGVQLKKSVPLLSRVSSNAVDLSKMHQLLLYSPSKKKNNLFRSKSFIKCRRYSKSFKITPRHQSYLFSINILQNYGKLQLKQSERLDRKLLRNLTVSLYFFQVCAPHHRVRRGPWGLGHSPGVSGRHRRRDQETGVAVGR